MAFLESQLDPLITKGAKSTIEWSRTKVYTHGGLLRQNFNWSTAKHFLDLSYRARPAAQYEALRDFFMVVMAGAYEGFRAKDWSNYELTQDNSELVLVTGSDYQIHRKHSAGGQEYLHPIKKPTGTVTIIRNRSSVITVASATVDNETGIATIGGHVGGDTYTAECEYDTPVTFEGDEWVTNLEVSTADLWLSPEPIRLEEITRSLA
jgi:uncharacterized protein (TIGR02217 family)